MKLKRCRVQNYRCITDSSWVDIDDIAVIVGKNESGKTSFLKALWRLNPYDDISYEIDREWPIGRRQEKDPKAVVVQAEFSFSDEEQAKIEKFYKHKIKIQGLKVDLNYEGKRTCCFLPEHISTEDTKKWLLDDIQKPLHLNKVVDETTGQVIEFSDHFVNKYQKAHINLIEKVTAEIKNKKGRESTLQYLNEIKNQLVDFCAPTDPHHLQDLNNILFLQVLIDETISVVEVDPMQEIEKFVEEKMPKFIYMDDYRTFVGSAQLNEIQTHRDASILQPHEETTIMIVEMAGLNLDKEVERGEETDSEQRMYDMNDASKRLTTLLAHRWTQEKYEVVVNVDHQHFVTFIKREGDENSVRLEEKSKGFQWFFSFDMLFTHETEGNYKNSIILLDEPGLHLHASAQKDLLNRMKEYAKDNQLIYTTHLPSMIDLDRPDNIYIAEDITEKGTIIRAHWASHDKEARFTLQAALGIDWSQSLFISKHNLVVEGVTDLWFLNAFSNLFKNAGKNGLDLELVIIPAGSASRIPYFSTILHRQNLNVLVLLDSDKAGEDAYKKLVHTKILPETVVMKIGTIIKRDTCSIEDLFGEAYYIQKVEEVYSKELEGKPICLDPETAGRKSLAARVGDYFNKHKLGNFNKTRIAKIIEPEIRSSNLNDFDKPSADSFEKLITAINKVVTKWKKGSMPTPTKHNPPKPASSNTPKRLV